MYGRQNMQINVALYQSKVLNKIRFKIIDILIAFKETTPFDRPIKVQFLP